jgi:hypothetical protein
LDFIGSQFTAEIMLTVFSLYCGILLSVILLDVAHRPTDRTTEGRFNLRDSQSHETEKYLVSSAGPGTKNGCASVAQQTLTQTEPRMTVLARTRRKLPDQTGSETVRV